MAALVRTGFSFAKNTIFSTAIRSIATTRQVNVKEIRECREGSSLIIDAVQLPSPRTELLVRADKIKSLCGDDESNLPSIPCNEAVEKPPCYMCSLGLDVKHTDILILSQFIRSDGCMLPRRITKLCRRQQKKIGKMVTMAQKAGLMINMTPKYCNKDPKKRRDYKKFNTYFDETTIFMKKIPKPVDRFKR